MKLVFYLLVSLLGLQTSNAKVYFENDFYMTNTTTNYSNIPTDCNLFGKEFEEDYPEHKLIINSTETGSYWVGAKIGFERNINPLGVPKDCNAGYNGSLDECNRHCKGWKYLSYKEYSCRCSNEGKVNTGITKAKNCENPKYGLCSDENCVLYERDILTKDYICDAYHFKKGDFKNWVFTTRNCSDKLSFICEGDKDPSNATNSSWLVAEHMCSQKGKNLLQTAGLLDEGFKDGKKYWVSFFRRKKISWGEEFTKTVCVAARIQKNGSIRLESQLCNKKLQAICHILKDTNDGSSETEIMAASLGTVLGGVLVCITVVAAIMNRRNRHLQNIQTNQQPLEDCEKSSTSTDGIMNKYTDGQMYSNTDVPFGDFAIYSLAKDYSDPEILTK